MFFDFAIHQNIKVGDPYKMVNIKVVQFWKKRKANKKLENIPIQGNHLQRQKFGEMEKSLARDQKVKPMQKLLAEELPENCKI